VQLFFVSFFYISKHKVKKEITFAIATSAHVICILILFLSFFLLCLRDNMALKQLPFIIYVCI